MKTQLKRLFDFILEENKKGNDCFFNYSGHVSFVTVYGFKGKWNKKRRHDFYISLDLEFLLKEKPVKQIVDETIAQIKEALS